jgi:hypothetical protein
MQREVFLQQLQQFSGNINPETANLTMRFPFFYAAHLLESIQLKETNPIKFESSIRATSLLSPNRELLKNLVEGRLSGEVEQINVEPPTPTIVIVDAPGIVPIEINTEPAVLEQISAYPELVKTEQISEETKIVRVEANERRMTFSSWLKQMGGSNQHNETPSSEESDREELIRKFIETEPQISKPQKASFYSAVEMARKSTEERDDIVSETLASVYAQQGDIARATRIYQKLCLLYPEKSSYFAALIKNLTTTH